MADTPQQTLEAGDAAPAGKTLYPRHPQHHGKRNFLHKHSLSIVSSAIVVTWIVAYRYSDPSTHFGSFFGNAIADWAGVVVTVLATKWLYEKNSAESRRCPPVNAGPVRKFFHEHSLTVFLVITGIGWVVLFAKMDPNGKWGQVIGNIVSEWTQIFGMVLLTKKLIEAKSKAS
jgi:hypothetical protein